MPAGERELVRRALARRTVARRTVARLGLNVFGYNTPAIRLYQSLGFAVTSQQMAKSLPGL